MHDRSGISAIRTAPFRFEIIGSFIADRGVFKVIFLQHLSLSRKKLMYRTGQGNGFHVTNDNRNKSELPSEDSLTIDP